MNTLQNKPHIRKRSQRLAAQFKCEELGVYADFSFREEIMQLLRCVTVVKCVSGCSSAALFWNGTMTAAERMAQDN